MLLLAASLAFSLLGDAQQLLKKDLSVWETTKNSVAVIDADKMTVKATWPIAPGEEASGLAIDAKNKRLFLAANKMMIVMDATNGKVISRSSERRMSTGSSAT